MMKQMLCVQMMEVKKISDKERGQCLKSASTPTKLGWPDSPQPSRN